MVSGLEYKVLGNSVRQSTVEHSSTGVGGFAKCTVSEGEVIEMYYGSIVYSYLFPVQLSMKEYGEGNMKVLIELFTWFKKALQINATDCSSIKRCSGN